MLVGQNQERVFFFLVMTIVKQNLSDFVSQPSLPCGGIRAGCLMLREREFDKWSFAWKSWKTFVLDPSCRDSFHNVALGEEF